MVDGFLKREFISNIIYSLTIYSLILSSSSPWPLSPSVGFFPSPCLPLSLTVSEDTGVSGMDTLVLKEIYLPHLRSSAMPLFFFSVFIILFIYIPVVTPP